MAPRSAFPHCNVIIRKVARAELVELLTTYRGDFAAGCACAPSRRSLHWLRPGSVLAMDFSHPPVLIDGCSLAIFHTRRPGQPSAIAVWLPAENETADTVICGLHELFEEHGKLPLVLKCDNGPGVRSSCALKQLRATARW